MNWNLNRLYPGFDDPTFISDLNSISARGEELLSEVKAAADWRDMERLIDKFNDLYAPVLRVGLFVQLTLAVDSQNADALRCMDKLMRSNVTLSKVYSELSKLTQRIDIAEGCANSETLKYHEYFLKQLAREAAHTIKDPAVEDAVLKMQLTGGSAFEQLRDQLDAGHMIELNGEKLPLSAVRGKAYSESADERRAAYEAEIAAYPAIETAMAACLNAIKGEALTLCELRAYDTVLDTALAASRMDMATLDAMLSAMRESLPDFRRYFRAKARMLGYAGGLKFYDLFAPVGEGARKYTLEEARDTLVEVMSKFTPEMGAFIKNAFDENWIDAYPKEGKVGGAFCAGAQPILKSYVLANFDGSLASVGTLAHELGHAYHNSRTQHLTYVMADYPMPLAETASIFNETLLVNRMLEGADAQTRATLLDQQISDAAQVIVDILSRYIFETEVVSRRKDSTLTPSELCDIMTEAQKATYGDGLDENCMHKYMWACKSHYYSTGVHFYNFPYAFGLLFGLGVYALYLKQGSAFPAVYDKLLEATCLGDVRDVAASVGIDVSDVGFWRSSLDVMRARIAEFEALCP